MYLHIYLLYNHFYVVYQTNNEMTLIIRNSEFQCFQIFADKFTPLSWYNLEISVRVDEQSVRLSLKWSTFVTQFVIIQIDGRSTEATH